jgi:hypothetical protein
MMVEEKRQYAEAGMPEVGPLQPQLGNPPIVQFSAQM